MTPSLSDLRAFILDMDGVLYAGATPLPGAQAFVAHLQATGTPFLFLTNNSSRTPEQYAAKLAAMSIAVSPQRIFTSALATAQWLQTVAPVGARVLLIGELGIQQALAERGFQLTTDYQQADYVVVGYDSQFTYAKARAAALAIQRGAPFIATNTDASLPSEEGEIPGAGAIVAMIETATGRKARAIGKPEPGIFLQALTRLGSDAAHTAIVGDRYETDIVGGHRAGLKTIGVLSGVTSAERFATADPPADWVYDDLAALLAAWKEATSARGATESAS